MENGHIIIVPMDFKPAMEITYGLICLVCVFIGAPGNAFSLYYFLSKRKDISTVIYICLTAVDTLICMTALPVGISYLKNRDPVLFGDIVFCNLWQVCYRILSSQYIFYVALLSITRTFFLLKPFKTISVKLIKAFIAIYFVLQCCFSTIVFWEEGGYYKYLNIFVDCSTGSIENSKFETFYNIMSKLTYTMPIFPIILSCVISMYVLLVNTTSVQDNDEKRYASVTIVMFTILYAVFNIPASLLNIIPGANELKFDKFSYFGNFVFGLSIPLHSLFNPILYMVRMKNLKAFLTARLFSRSKQGNERLQMAKMRKTINSQAG